MPSCEFHREIEARTLRNEEDIKTIFELVEKVRNRLPHWATATISLLTLIVGWLLSRVF